ncbi:hypothetical protein CLV98_12026 [Dyadobacter jejuensis]|uniref:DUF4468 domain-containing protein n=1 Tax=Dyadobacter jejuensis TaxID=1082580 RepID=A0A316AA76_9BACT|nr:hypothetical protein [Dyadobacter jejuensis]PWJ53910.1 hypothetical protein CLV98_12026 [Dyadobacter jejuensis]
MKANSLILVALLLIISCRSNKLSISSTPRQSFTYPIHTETTASFEEVWAKLVDIIAINGYKVDRLDKQNGIFVAKIYRGAPYSIADDNGRNTDENAFVVVPKIKFQSLKGRKVKSTRLIHPDSVNYEVNVRIRANGLNGTMINVNIPRIQIGGGYYSYRQVSPSFPKDTIILKIPMLLDPIYWSTTKSTGVLEKYIIDAIKDGDLNKIGELRE